MRKLNLGIPAPSIVVACVTVAAHPFHPVFDISAYCKPIRNNLNLRREKKWELLYSSAVFVCCDEPIIIPIEERRDCIWRSISPDTESTVDSRNIKSITECESIWTGCLQPLISDTPLKSVELLRNHISLCQRWGWLPRHKIEAEIMILIQWVCNCRLWSKITWVGAFIGLPEKYIGILHTHACCGWPFTKTMEVFRENINFVLPLMEHFSTEIFVLWTVAVGGIWGTGSETTFFPVFYVIGFDGVCLIAIFDVGVCVCQILWHIGKLFLIIREWASKIEWTAEIDNEHLFSWKILLPIERYWGGSTRRSMRLGQ